MSRRGLIIRLLIFVPLFAYFGYGAYQKWRTEQAVADEAPTSRKMQLPDGRTIDVIELTPEQAERQFGVKLPPEPTVSDANKPAPTQGEGKADTNKPELKLELPPPGAPAPGGATASGTAGAPASGGATASGTAGAPAPGGATSVAPAPAAAN